MGFCKRVLCVVLSFFICVVAFSGVSLSASASAGTRTLTPAETRALIGDTIPAQYYDGSGMVDFTFSYGGSSTLGRLSVDGSPSLTFSAGDSVIWYSAQVSPNTNPQYITVDVRPRYSFFDTEIIQQMCGLTTDLVPGVSVYSPPSWRWHTSYSGDLIIENQLTANSYYYAICDIVLNGTNRHVTFIDADFSQQSTFSAYSDRALFYGNSAVSGWMYFVVTCPTVSDSSTMASGTDIGNGSGGTGDITVTVDVDMSETNGFLGSILDFLEGLLAGIAGLFVPTHADFLQWLEDLHDCLQEHFGAFFDSMLIIDQVFNNLESAPDATATIGLAEDFVVPFADGLTFTAEDWSFELVPVGFGWLQDMLRGFVDILCTILFLNMLRNRWEHFLDPDSPET